METRYYASAIGWWVYFIIPVFIIGCVLVPFMLKHDFLTGLSLTVILCVLIYTPIFNVRFAIRGREFGIRSLFQWHWYPIDKIESITSRHSILATTTATSSDRLAIKFSDPKVLKSFAPIEISPKDRDGFITALLNINPNIKVSL